MVMFLLEDSSPEVVNCWNKDPSFIKQERCWRYRPMGLCIRFRSHCLHSSNGLFVLVEGGKDVSAEAFQIKYSTAHVHLGGFGNDGGNLMRRKEWFRVARIHCGVVAPPLFRIDVPLSCQSVRLCSQPSWSKVKLKVERVEVFRPSRLSPGENFSCCEVLQIFMVRIDVNRKGGAL